MLFVFLNTFNALKLSLYNTGYNLQQHPHGGIISNPSANQTYPVPLVTNTVTRETFSGAMGNAWTVEEQIYKSKLWLQQRNQSMLPKP